MSSNPSIRSSDLEELEIHLRDEWESLVSSGMNPEKAFEEARNDLGNISDLADAYDDVNLEKIFWKGQTRSEMDILKTTAGNYLKSAWRNVIRHKGYSTLNISGLALALASALTIGLFIRHSLSYDDYHERADDTYRIVMDRGFPGENSGQSFVTTGLADVIRSEWAGAEHITQMRGTYSTEQVMTVDQVHFMMSGVLEVDENFPDVFSLSFIEGSGPASLDAPRSMLLTESTAQLFFGDEDATGRTIRVDATADYTVTAVVKDPPANTHLPFNVLIRGYTEPLQLSWNSIGNYTYIVLPAEQEASRLSKFLTDRYEKDNPGAIGSFSLQPIRDIHLASGVQDDYTPQGDSRYLLIFGSIGILILVLACINYVNLATARADRRVREVGVRKVIGASGAQLRRQFLLESLLMTLLSVPFALLGAAVALPRINSLAGESLEFSMLMDPVMWAVLTGLLLIVSLGAGFYPAVLMARKNPVEVFAGSRSYGRARITLRQILVGTQVAIAFALIAITLVIAGQLEFIRGNRLGFDAEQIVTLMPRGWSEAQFTAFQSEITSNSAVQSAATGLPMGLGWRYYGWTQTLPEDGSEVDLEEMPIGVGFVETMGLELLEGRTFSEIDLNSGKPPLIVSSSYAEVVGNGSSVVGTEMAFGNGGQIVGVVRDFRNSSYTDSKNITVLRLDAEMTRFAVVKLTSQQILEGLQAMRRAWTKISPDRPMNYQFLDERIQAQYVEEIRFGSIFNIFSGLSIVIASLGLFGLAALTARQRDKEIAIRKSQGASAMNILALLVKEFLVVVFAGIVMSMPLVWIYSQEWLSGFNEHIRLDGSILLTSALICLTFVATAVIFRSLRAARANPVEALSWE